MVLTEFRIPLPLKVEEFQVAQLYMVVKASKEATGGGEGVEWVKNEPFDNTDGHMGISELSGVEVPRAKGQYTLKRYHLASHIPYVVQKMLPADAMMLVEEAWNAYPHCKTVLTNGYLSKDKLRIIVESMHLPDAGQTENALNLSKDQLKKRSVEHLDVAALDPTAENYKEANDPRFFLSAKTGRGKLAKGWQASSDPVMCCYKLVTADFKYWGLQTKIEGTIESKNRLLFQTSLAQAFCLIDEWHGMTMADIRRLEDQSKAELNNALAAGGAVVEGDESKDNSGASAPAATAAPAADGASAQVTAGAGAGGSEAGGAGAGASSSGSAAAPASGDVPAPTDA